MSKVNSYRFDDQALYRLETISESLGINEKEVIEKAIENYFDKWVREFNGYERINVDFHKNFEGVNTGIVNTFIEEVEMYTHFKVYQYADGDQVEFYLEEN